MIFIQAHTLSHNPSLHFGNFLIIIEKKLNIYKMQYTILAMKQVK